MGAIRKLRDRIANSAFARLVPSPVKVRHWEYSVLFSEDDALSGPNERLMDISLKAIECARHVDLGDICARLGGRFPFSDDTVNLWPGEHYRMLAALVQVLRPSLIVEIGTAEGLSALSMRKYLPEGGSLVTFDLVPWTQIERRCLTADDFADKKMTQVMADLGDGKTFERHRPLIERAGLIFIDAAKDGALEDRLVAHLETVSFSAKPIVVFDDIRLWNMLRVWRQLRWPKLDITSFGHWCGTGICEPGTLVRSLK